MPWSAIWQIGFMIAICLHALIVWVFISSAINPVLPWLGIGILVAGALLWSLVKAVATTCGKHRRERQPLLGDNAV